MRNYEMAIVFMWLGTCLGTKPVHAALSSPLSFGVAPYSQRRWKASTRLNLIDPSTTNGSSGTNPSHAATSNRRDLIMRHYYSTDSSSDHASFSLPRNVARREDSGMPSTSALSTTPTPLLPVVVTFQDRMRKLALQQQRKQQFQAHREDRTQSQTTPQSKRLRLLQPFRSTSSSTCTIPEVTTLADLHQFLTSNPAEKLIVVRFYAPWCKACKAMEPQFHKLIRQLHAEHQPVQFVNVPITDRNAILHQGLGIPSIPYAHVYHPQAGLVHEMRLLKPHVRDLQQIVQSYMVGGNVVSFVRDDPNAHDHGEPS